MTNCPLPNNTAEKRAFRINEASALYGISRSTIYKIMAAGTLRTVKIGGRRLIPRDALEALFERGREMTGTDKLSPALAALASGKDRANIVHKQAPSTIAGREPEADFAALYLRRRFGLSPCLAQAVAALAKLGRALS